MGMKYTNTVQVRLRSCLKSALSLWFGVDESDCPVVYTGQPIPETAKRCVTFSKVTSHRVGFQGKKIVTDDEAESGFVEIEYWTDELTFQINARAKETIFDDEDTPTARDIAEGLAGWVNGYAGIETMNELGLYPLRVADLRNLTSIDESDQFQNTVSFDLTIHVGQSKILREVDSQDARLKDIKGV